MNKKKREIESDVANAAANLHMLSMLFDDDVNTDRPSNATIRGALSFVASALDNITDELSMIDDRGE